jgi:hypothetical protein
VPARTADGVVTEHLGVAVGRTRLGPAVDLANGGIDIDHQARGPGPVPSAQARRRLSAITASNCRTWPKLNARKKQPKVDGAMTRCPSTPGRPRPQAVGVADVAGPGHHGMHQGQDLAAGTEPAGPVGEPDCGVDQGLQTQAGHQRGHQDQPGVGHQARLVENHLHPVNPARYWLH